MNTELNSLMRRNLPPLPPPGMENINNNEKKSLHTTMPISETLTHSHAAAKMGKIVFEKKKNEMILFARQKNSQTHIAPSRQYYHFNSRAYHIISVRILFFFLFSLMSRKVWWRKNMNNFGRGWQHTYSTAGCTQTEWMTNRWKKKRGENSKALNVGECVHT